VHGPWLVHGPCIACSRVPPGCHPTGWVMLPVRLPASGFLRCGDFSCEANLPGMVCVYALIPAKEAAAAVVACRLLLLQKKQQHLEQLPLLQGCHGVCGAGPKQAAVCGGSLTESFTAARGCAVVPFTGRALACRGCSLCVRLCVCACLLLCVSLVCACLYMCLCRCTGDACDRLLESALY
jgi:hypothetical protein